MRSISKNTMVKEQQAMSVFLNPGPFIRTWIGIVFMANLFLWGQVALGQVGIGNPTPDSTSVLDLTNPNNKGLVLPSASGTGTFSSGSVLGITYFSNDHIYYKRSDGYNALTPWKYKFNGNISEDVYYNSGGNIGIGVTNLSASPEAPLQVMPDQPVSLSGNGTVMIGSSLNNNLVINSGEIQTRNTGSAAPLKINEDGGDITLGSPGAPVQLSVSGKVREFHQPSGQFYELISPGTIVMWYGTTADIPTGWAICDGGSYPRSDGSGSILAPDLSGKFVVGVGNNGSSTYAPHDTGGADSVALAANELGQHNHFISLTTSTTGNHSHGMNGSFYQHDGNGSGGDDGFQTAGNDQTQSAGSHNHSVSGNTQFSGQGDPHENRPQYHALVFIIKL